MNIYNYLQVNSHFVYSKKLDLGFTKNLEKIKVKVKKYNNNQFCSLLESAVFGEQKVYIHLVSKQGEFILTNVTNEIPHDKILDYLKVNALNNKTYYFSNVDYFSYGRFGVAEDGKIVRYLAYNSEAVGDEEIVIWIGKPHDWEYKTHTFFTKKKLEDCEMDFGWDEVCQMSEFYLPFINDEIDIISCTIFGTDKNYLKSLLVQKKKKEKNKFTKEQNQKIYEFLTRNNTNNMCFILRVSNNNIVIDSQILCTYYQNKKIEEQKVLTNYKTYSIFYKFIDNPEKAFKESMFKAVQESEKAEIEPILDFVNKKKKFKGCTCFYLMFNYVTPRKLNIYLASYEDNDKINRNIFLGTKLTDKVCKQIYNFIVKWFKEENELK